MAKEVAGQIKLQIKGGAANPSPPVGPALGSKGINIMEFCKQFNAKVKTIAEDKLVDLNCFTVESAMKMVAGTARSMGITVKGTFPGNN